MSDTLRTIFALPSLQEFIVICGMLLATYSTRLIGWLVLRRHPVSPRMQRILDAAPLLRNDFHRRTGLYDDKHCDARDARGHGRCGPEDQFGDHDCLRGGLQCTPADLLLKSGRHIGAQYGSNFACSSRFFRGLKARAESYSSLRRSAGRAKACGLRV